MALLRELGGPVSRHSANDLKPLATPFGASRKSPFQFAIEQMPETVVRAPQIARGTDRVLSVSESGRRVDFNKSRRCSKPKQVVKVLGVDAMIRECVTVCQGRGANDGKARSIQTTCRLAAARKSGEWRAPKGGGRNAQPPLSSETSTGFRSRDSDHLASRWPP